MTDTPAQPKNPLHGMTLEKIVTELAAGQSYARPQGVEHNVVNPNAHEFAFVEVELK